MKWSWTCTRCGADVGNSGVVTVDLVLVDGQVLHEYVRECHECAKKEAA